MSFRRFCRDIGDHYSVLQQLECFYYDNLFVRLISLEDFVAEDDHMTFGPGGLEAIRALVDIQIDNTYNTIDALHSHLDDINLLHPDHLRPCWDQYFMV